MADFIGQVKGVSSVKFNRDGGVEGPLWQREYGVFSLSREQLPFVVKYVQEQKTHHQSAKLIPILERVDEDVLVKEEANGYVAGYDDWSVRMQAE